MKAVRSTFLDLSCGDVVGVGIVHFRDHSRIVVYHDDAHAPLIQLTLTECERIALISALGVPLPPTQQELRRFRQERRQDSR